MWDLINAGIPHLTASEALFFEAIRVNPEKWTLDPWGNEGGGFWVIGVIGKTVIWFNDIEDDFNHSLYKKYGTIGEYWCNQDDFPFAVKLVKSLVDTGSPHARAQPPKIP